jgi:hypothetical protein
MIPLSQLGKRAGRMVIDNSPAILSSAAIAGVATTAVLAAKGGIKAAEILRNEAEEGYLDYEASKNELLKQQFQLTWKCYIPAVAAGAVTVACVVGSQQISSKRQAAALGLYTLSETAFREYKEKVVEQIGANKEQKVRDEVAQDRVTKTAPKSEIVIVEDGDILCVDLMTNTYFKSNMEKLRRAMNDVNQMILSGDMYASHNDFLNRIGLESNGMGEQIGWNIDNLIDLTFSSVLSPEGKPCLAFGYAKMPKADYHKFG